MDLSSMDRPLRRREGSASFGARAASYANMSRVFSARSMAGSAVARGVGALSKLESIASTAVRAADKVKVRLRDSFAGIGCLIIRLQQLEGFPQSCCLVDEDRW